MEGMDICTNENKYGTKSDDDMESKFDVELFSETEGEKLDSSEQPKQCVNDHTAEINNSSNASLSMSSRKSEAMKRKQNIKQSRIAAVQGLLYVGSALATAVWVFMPWVGTQLRVNAQWRFFFAFMVNIASPSQGVFSLFIYVRLHYLKLRETNNDWSRLKCVKECLFSSD
jgi:hypothetical protein